jgi:hypothetical protein
MAGGIRVGVDTQFRQKGIYEPAYFIGQNPELKIGIIARPID